MHLAPKKKEGSSKGEEPSAFVRGTVHPAIAATLIEPEVVKDGTSYLLLYYVVLFCFLS
jgi:hypothetical protein